MSKIDWSKAPEGATHYFPNVSSGHWRDLSGELGKWWDGKEWRSTGLSSSVFGDLTKIPRPSSPAWSGPKDGLPAAGEVIRLRTKRDPDDAFEGWGKAEIMYSSNSAVVWRWQGHSREFGSEWSGVEFEQIRTPEQIAAEQRESAIEEMVADAQPASGNANRIIAERLYLAGWRKVEQPK